MCGLIGVFGEQLWNSEEDLFKQGLVVSQLRGQDSTGVAVIHGKTNMVKVLKGAYDSTAFLAKDEVNKLISRTTSCKVFLGHVRYATHGDVQDDHAHPFTHEHITLAHNGGINNKNSLVDGHKFEVDSEAICHSISKIGMMETLQKVTGAFALSYYDAKERRFNLVRNSGRELYIAKHKHKKVWYYASEGPMLWMLFHRNNIDHEPIECIPTSTLYSYNLDTKELEKSEVDFVKKPDKSNWPGHYRTSDNRESESEDSQKETSGKASSSRVAFLGNRHNPGYDGQGWQHLAKWGLAIGDWVHICMDDGPEIINKQTGFMKGYGIFACQSSPNSNIWIYGFDEREYLKEKNTHGRYFTRITQCYWDASEQEYTIHCHDLKTDPPSHAKVVIPKNDSVEPSDPKVLLPALPTQPTEQKALVLIAEKAERATDRAVQDHKFLEARCIEINELHKDELVPGPYGSKILFSRWAKETEGGCCYCSGVLSLKSTKWFADNPVHDECMQVLQSGYGYNSPVD